MVNNARFWVWYNGGYVKLVLRPSEELSVYIHGQTEEGYRSEQTIWAHNGTNVAEFNAWCERDCDGTASSQSEVVADLDQLAVNLDAEENVMRPNWINFREECRDYAAESMNY